MTKSTIARERLEKIKSWRETYGTGSNVMLPAEEAEELACLALAAMNGEPVAYISKSDFDAGYPHILARRDFNKACTMPVYAAQPAPVVPEEMTPEMMRSVQLNSELGAYAASNLSGAYDLFAEFWKVACRAAMLSGGKP